MSAQNKLQINGISVPVVLPLSGQVSAFRRQRVLPRWLIWARVLVICVTLVGLGFRLHGIAYGLPYFYGPPEVEAVRTGFARATASGSDEPQFVNATMRLLAHRSLNPEYFAQPGTPLMYMGAVLYVGVIGTGLVSGAFASIEDASVLFASDPTIFYLTFRLLVAVIGAASVPLVYMIGRRMFGRRAGLIAAAVFAVSPIHVYLSKVIRGDVLMIFFLLAAFWFCLDIVQRASWRGYVLAGAMTGLAVVCKYPAATFIPVIVAAHLLAGKMDHRKLVASGAACVAGAFIGSPYVFLDFAAVLAAVRQESLVHLSGVGKGFLPDLVWYLGSPLVNSISAAGVVLMVVGVGLCVASKDRARWLLLLFPLIFIVFITGVGILWERWIVPAIPFLCLIAGFAAVWIADRLGRIQKQAGVAAVMGAARVMSLPLAQLSVLHGDYLIAPETRTLARAWMLEHIPQGTRVLLERHGPQPPKALFTTFEERRGEVTPIDISQRTEHLYAVGELGLLKDFDQIGATGIEYMVLTDYYSRYLEEAAAWPEMIARYETLRGMGEIIYEIKAQAGAYSGPHITIIRLNNAET